MSDYHISKESLLKSPGLPERIADVLRREIREKYGPGQRLPTVRSLRTRFDVSINTIDQAIGLLVRENLVESWQGSGVYVTDRIHERRIGIYSELDLLQPRVSSYHTIQASALRRYFTEQEATAEVYLGTSKAGGEKAGQPTNRRFLDDVATGRLDGVVFVNESVTDVWCEWNKRFPLPFVGGCWSPYKAEHDRTALIREGVEQLVAQGCRRLAFLTWETHMVEFREALAAHRLEARPVWERHDLEPSLPGAGWEEFREIWAADADKPDGLLVCDDFLADGATRAIQELGIRVPDQLRLVVQTNKGSGMSLPFPVIQLEIDPAEAAELLGAMLLDLLAGRVVAQPKPILPFAVITTGRDDGRATRENQRMSTGVLVQ